MKKLALYLGLIALLAIIGIGIYALTSHDGAGSGSPTVNETGNETVAAVAAPKAVEASPWMVSGPGPVWKLYTADDGTLYSFQGEYGNTIRAIDPNGSMKWEYQVPDEWRVSNVMFRPVEDMWQQIFGLGFTGPVFSIDNGTLYLYVRDNTTTDYNHYPYEEHPGSNQYSDYKLKERLMAISEGRLLWDVPISNEHHSFDDSNVFAQNGRVYVFDDYNVMIFSDNGSILFRIDDASSPPAVDEDGNIYVVPAIPTADQMLSYMFSIYQDTVYKEPASIVRAYSPIGTLMWQKDIGSPFVRPLVTKDLIYQYDTLPLYHNHTLYLPTDNQIVALSTDGSVKWSKKYERSIKLMPSLPFDENGNVYVTDAKWSLDSSIRIVSADGSEQAIGSYYESIYGDATDGIIYSLRNGMSFPPVYLHENDSRPVLLSGLYLTPYSPLKGTMLWKHKIEQNETNIIIDSDNVKKLQSMDIDVHVVVYNAPMPVSTQIIRTTADTIYVYDFNAEYEWPVVVNETRCNYSSTICAFDKSDGRLLWQKDLDATVTSMETDNGTLYYGTRDGRVFGGITRDRSEPPPPSAPAVVTGNMGKVVETVAGGAAVTAAAVLFIKFFALGGLARARGQLTANDNRNKTLEFIAGHPGSTLHEIAHGLGINVGTIRYHLFILSLNHRVVLFKSDGKFVRYFTNSGSYTKDEQFLLSLVRRDPVRKILNLLLERSEISNIEISEALKMHDSATSRYLKELAARGVVAKRSLAGGRTSYSLRREFREPVAMAIERMNGD